MASEEDVTSDSLDTSVRDVPAELLDYVKSRIIENVKKAEDFSAKVHTVEGHSPKMVVSFGENRPAQQTHASTHATNDQTNTNTLLVKKLPETADEDLLEMFFESTKKQGGGPVKSVKILSGGNIALVEFCDPKSVETVIKKKPIKLGKTELEVQPYSPLIKGPEKINRVDLIGFVAEFTNDLVKKHIEYLSGAAIPDYGPELRALIKVGSRVVRGRDWKHGNLDSGGEGTVTGVYDDLSVSVRWDNGKIHGYRIGHSGCYDIKLAP